MLQFYRAISCRSNQRDEWERSVAKGNQILRADTKICVTLFVPMFSATKALRPKDFFQPFLSPHLRGHFTSFGFEGIKLIPVDNFIEGSDSTTRYRNIAI